MFFGTFLDGSLAGSTFEFTEADSGGGFVLALLSGIPTAVTCLVSSSICKKIARKTNVRY